MTFTKKHNEVEPMTLDAAYRYAGRVIELERRGTGDTEGALFRIEQTYGLGANQVMHLASKRAKSCDLGLFARLQAAYLDLCARQVTRLQHEIATEKATGDDTVEDLEAEARALAAKIQAKKQAMRAGR